MGYSRRRWMQTSAAGAAAAAFTSLAPEPAEAQQAQLPESFSQLQPVRDRIRPITVDEFRERIARAQQLMTDSRPP
ncbi:MAG TPA: twin-arginine translocation signal domain-containing protein, partial [Candidatus Acidoferrales bacterium]